MIIRSRAPLRLGLAGGGTDVAPYSDIYGGAILNLTISLYAYANIQLLPNAIVQLYSIDQKQEENFTLHDSIPIKEGKDNLKLLKGVINYIQKHIGQFPCGFQLCTFVDAPAGSGLGTSSTLVVAILGAFVEWLKLPWGDYDIAHYAYTIEREYLALSGGKQDQYAATFGGVNFMEFYAQDKVIVNPLRIRYEYIHELENNLLLYYTSTSRESAKIIEEQKKNVIEKNEKSIEAMHQLKEQAKRMKEVLLKGQIDEIGAILDFGFQEKRKIAHSISNPYIEHLYEVAKKAGASGGKISGAGGGGYMFFYCPKNTKYQVQEALKKEGGNIHPYQIIEKGLTHWTI